MSEEREVQLNVDLTYLARTYGIQLLESAKIVQKNGKQTLVLRGHKEE